MRAAFPGLSTVCLLATVAVSHAQAPQPTPEPQPFPGAEAEVASEEVEAVSSSYDMRSHAEDWMIAPGDTVRVGLETTLVTADADVMPLLGTRQLALTDLALLRASIGYSVAGKVELLAALSLLPKQPIATDASVFQGGELGIRVGLAPFWALTLTAMGGPTIDGDGGWVDGALTLDARYEADRYVLFTGHLGGGATGLIPERELIGLSEVLTGAQVILQAPNKAAVITGIDFAFPIGSSASPPFELDPQTRVDVHVTCVLALADDWDVWLRAAVIDRGELGAPDSLLPILDGGFDQQQLTLGVSYRSRSRDPDFAL